MTVRPGRESAAEERDRLTGERHHRDAVESSKLLLSRAREQLEQSSQRLGRQAKRSVVHAAIEQAQIDREVGSS